MSGSFYLTKAPSLAVLRIMLEFVPRPKKNAQVAIRLAQRLLDSLDTSCSPILASSNVFGALREILKMDENSQGAKTSVIRPAFT